MHLDPNPRRGASSGRLRILTVVATLVLALGACSRSDWDPTLKIGDPKGHVVDRERPRTQGAETRPLNTEAPVGGPDSGLAKAVTLQHGTGTFVRKIKPPRVDTSPGDVTLNFDGTDLREVVKVVLGDLLKVNYVLHPAVQGVVSLQTGRPLRRDDLIPTLETLLRMNNAALVYRDGTYEVLPLANAMQGKVVPQLGDTSRALPEGYSVQVVPLRYIGAEEMNSILQPLAPEGSVIRVDNMRNLLVIAGTSREMGNLLDTIRVFDVDWMSGLSVGFFVLEYAKAKDVTTQLEGLLSDEGGNAIKGLFRFVPIESANALLVVAHQDSYIEQARNWIERLDMAEAAGDANERLFVYRVKHSDAAELADTLSKLYGGGSGSRGEASGSVAPGLGKSSIGSSGSGSSSSLKSKSSSKLGDSSGKFGETGSTTTTGGDGLASQTGNQTTATARQIDMTSPVNIVADQVNNSLLIRSSPRDYKKILDALKQLDILPLQVLVEASIVEITLEGSLKYGVQWQLFGPASKGKSFASLDGTLDSSTNSGINTSFPGFNWALVSSADTVTATLSALAGNNLVNVLSSPSVMVMDNQTAKIQVGEQVPILTSQQQSTSTDSNVVNSIEYKDTGVMLTVRPRVTPGGLVLMEIAQEVSTVQKTTSSDLNSPTFQKRNITSSVAVRSNQAVVLGGLIQDEKSDTKSGIPGLYNIPFAGALFGERSKSANRTELVIVLTPKIIASDQDVESVTDDFRKKVKGLEFKF